MTVLLSSVRCMHQYVLPHSKKKTTTTLTTNLGFVVNTNTVRCRSNGVVGRTEYDLIPSWTTTDENQQRRYYNNNFHAKNSIDSISKMDRFRSGQNNYSIRPRYFSTTTTNHTFQQQRIGIDCQKMSTLDKGIYQSIIEECIKYNITTMEAGQEGGDELLASTLRPYLEQPHDSSPVIHEPIQILLRVGYRMMNRLDDTKKRQLFAQDVQLSEQPSQSSSSIVSNSDNDEEPTTTLLHNIHPTYIEHFVQNSPCIQLRNQYPQQIRITVVLHNPEEQHILTTTDGIQKRLATSFTKLQELVTSNIIDGYGICSNGLCLPNEHPLHLSWNDTVVPALHDASKLQNNSENDVSDGTITNLAFQVLQFPCNVMETKAVNGFAKEIKGQSALYPNLQLYGMRPLSCYPDRGTGTGYPFLLFDYQLPATMDKVLTWSNEMSGQPRLYDIAYTTAVQHFDAQDIIDKQAEAIAKGTSVELSVEERETLDGCKLLQSLLHDLDISLQTVRSVQQYENDLITKIIPLIRDTFDSYDDETAAILQSYFGAYAVAVKYSVARNIRQLILQQGEETSSLSSSSNNDDNDESNEIRTLLTQDKRLQEFAIEYILRRKAKDGQTGNENTIIDTVIVGCTEPWQVQDLVTISNKINSK